MQTITGLLHIHTTYSYDGRITLDDCAAIARAKGHSFLLLTEHNNDFSDRKMEELCEHSQRLSDDSFRVIPGLEIDCDFGRHLLAVGVSRYIPEGKPNEVAHAIADCGGLVILPHPALYQFRSFVSPGTPLNGVEVWNNRYDIRYAPNPKSFALLESLQKDNPSVLAFGGLDLHGKGDLHGPCLRLGPVHLTPDHILSNLREGNFEVVSRTLTFSAHGKIGSLQRLRFDVCSALVFLYRSFLPVSKSR